MSLTIFLDFDGVLNSKQSDCYWKWQYLKTGIYKSPYDEFCLNAVSNLNTLVSMFNAKIVFSTSWRIHADVQTLAQVLVVHGGFQYPEACIDKCRDGAKRKEYIRDYIVTNNITEYIILDDIDTELPNQILCDDKVGFDYFALERAIALLGKVEDPKWFLGNKVYEKNSSNR